MVTVLGGSGVSVAVGSGGTGVSVGSVGTSGVGVKVGTGAESATTGVGGTGVAFAAVPVAPRHQAERDEQHEQEACVSHSGVLLGHRLFSTGGRVVPGQHPDAPVDP